VVQGCHTDAGSRWRFLWCRWQSNSTPALLSRPDTPLMRKFDPNALHGIISALRSEALSHGQATVIHHLLQAFETTMLSFTGVLSSDQRLAQLWKQVEAEPGVLWSVQGMAKTAGCSREHLRRLCLEQIGRPPQQQLTWIRLRHAARLLSTTHEKVETIAKASGYSSAFALSNAFRRWTGCRPSDLRNSEAARPHVA
jgi:transcriptional regulator GlxA family with amidase domain